MLGALGKRLSYANVMATLAFFLAIGGGAYAVFKLPNNSVGTKQLQTSAVTHSKLSAHAVTGGNVANNSLSGAQINAGTLGMVPKAAHATNADSATNAGHATNADQLGGSLASTYVKGPAEAFHGPQIGQDSCTGNPLFTWRDYDSANNSTTAFYRDPFGVVHLKGTVACDFIPTASIFADIFVLGAGYRPAKTENFAVPSAAGYATIVIDSSGNVFLGGGTGSNNPGANGWLELDGISFRCEPSGSDGCP